MVWIYTVCLAPEYRRISSFVWSDDVFNNEALSDYLAIGIPCLTMLCLEWWAYEIITIAASEISMPALRAQTIALNFYYLVYSFAIGFAIAAISCVGFALGAGQP